MKLKVTILPRVVVSTIREANTAAIFSSTAIRATFTAAGIAEAMTVPVR
jgi:hypothetical protein